MSQAAQRSTAELIQFPRRRLSPASMAVSGNEVRFAPATRSHNVMLAAGVLAGSLALHAAVIAALLQPAARLDSGAIPAIAVDIILGDNRPAGLGVVPAQENAVEVKPSEMAQLAAPARAPERVSRERADPLEPEQKQELPTPSMVQPLEAAPAKSAPPRSEPSKAMPARHRPPAAAARPQASSGISRGGSSHADPNYYGAVAAHLARYKRFPDEARSRGDHGRAQIRFSIDGHGQVRSVSLVHSSGSARLDREAQAMVYRASPFPAPPDGRPHSFTVPVDFSIH